MVRVTGAPVPDPTASELQLIDGRQLRQGARLACCLMQPMPYQVRLLSQILPLAAAVPPL
jgi:ferredoxin